MFVFSVSVAGIESIQSEQIVDFSGNPNFTPLLVINVDALLPEDPEYCPPLTIQVSQSINHKCNRSNQSINLSINQ